VQPDIEAIPKSEDYVLRAWDVEDGLPNNNVQDITQTPDGYLWLATWSGLARFDGVRFVTFAKGPATGLQTNEINELLTTKEGTLWAGSQSGVLARFRNGIFETIVAAPAQPGTVRAIHSLVEDIDGDIWAGLVSNARAIRWKEGHISEFSSADGLGPGNFPYLQVSRDGTIWFATSNGCGFFDGQRFQQFPANDGNNVRLGAAQGGGMWVARGHQLFRYWKYGGRDIVADLSWLGGSQPVSVLYEDRQGAIWIGTQNAGLFRFLDGKFERVPTTHSSIAAIYQDREDNLWVATQGGGLDRLSARGFFIHKAKGFPSDLVSSIDVDAQGRICMVQGRELVLAEDATNHSFASPPGWKTTNDTLTILPDSTEGIWIGSLSNVLRCWKDGAYTIDLPFPGSITGFLKDSRQVLWIASVQNGLYCWQNGSLSRVDQKELSKPRALAQDSEGRIWVSTESGPVFRQEGKLFTPVTLPDARPGNRVQFIVPDGRDTLWLGAFESGLYRWQAGRIERLPEDTGLPTDNLKALEIDSEGNFWFGTGRGLFRVERREIEGALTGRRQTLRAVAYGRSNGLPTLNFNYGFLHTSTRTPDGHLWFATTNGALEVVPQNLSAIRAPNPVLIESLQVNGKPVPLAGASGNVILPPHPGTIQIRYTLPQMSAPEQLRFRTRLLGPDTTPWDAVGSQRTAVFTNPPAGTYIFQVEAADSPDRAGPQTASLTFTVQAAWWETIWFRFLCALTAALALALLVRTIVHRRMQARIRRLEQEHALERERTRIARDMHDELGARLTHIMLMSEVAANEPESPPDTLQKIAQTARTVSSTLDEIVWTTNPRNDTLEHLVGYIAEFTEEYLSTTGISLRMELPPEIPAREVSSEKRHHVLLVLKEALNNVVKHAAARHVHLRVTLDRGMLRVVIKDDGKGFDPASVAATSNGLINMRQRLVAISGTLKIESHPGRGTTVTLAAML
jgi:signal transduction histidine kinase/ligand-binding sensor domain-containing protein